VKAKTSTKKKEIVATRKTCKATGTGLSHYVMMDAKKK
jgi:modified peptide precursor CbpA